MTRFALGLALFASLPAFAAEGACAPGASDALGTLAGDVGALPAASCGSVAAELEEYRAWSEALTTFGLVPDRVWIQPRRRNDRSTVGVTLPGAAGMPGIGLVLRTADGTLPPALAAALADRGLSVSGTLASGAPLPGTPIRGLLDRRPQARWDRAHSLADRTLRNAGIDPLAPGHEMMRYATARYFLNGTTDQGLAWLSANFTGTNAQLFASKLIGSRWTDKIERTVESPFTNELALDNVRALGAAGHEAMTGIRATNTRHSPITYYLAGSLTKGRIGSKSDFDLLIDTPDKALERAILHGPNGFYGGGDHEYFAILDHAYFEKRGKYFGPTVRVDDPDALENDPLFLETFYLQQSRAWGLDIRRAADGKVSFAFLPDAVAKFEREAPRVTEELFGAMRPYRKHLDVSFVAKYFEDIPSIEPAMGIPAERLAQMGERLLEERLRCSVTPAALAAFLRGRAPESLGALEVADLAGVKVPFERLLIEVAAAARVKAAAEAGAPLSENPFAKDLAPLRQGGRS